jgi:uncharacterized protein YbjT (DUF2867 family)
MEKTALVFGATGLIGMALVDKLLKSEDYSQIKVFVRRKMYENSGKLVQIICDGETVESVKEDIKGDVLFCALGTTLKKAGSIAAFKKIDLDYVVKVADLAKQNGVGEFHVVSSIGTKKSANYYLQTKYEVEQHIKQLQFDKWAIMRPSLLLGQRDDSRMMETVAASIYPVLGMLMVGKMKKYRAIKGETVANAMVKLSLSNHENMIFESDEIEEI